MDIEEWNAWRARILHEHDVEVGELTEANRNLQAELDMHRARAEILTVQLTGAESYVARVNHAVHEALTALPALATLPAFAALMALAAPAAPAAAVDPHDWTVSGAAFPEEDPEPNQEADPEPNQEDDPEDDPEPNQEDGREDGREDGNGDDHGDDQDGDPPVSSTVSLPDGEMMDVG